MSKNIISGQLDERRIIALVTYSHDTGIMQQQIFYYYFTYLFIISLSIIITVNSWSYTVT